MTDETTTEAPEQPRTVKVFTCFNPRHPTRSCYALIEDTDEMRAKHREWHVSEETDRRARRDAIKSRDDEIARLHERIGEYKRAVDAYEGEVSKVHGEVQRVETPTPAPSLEINRAGYTDDELADEPEDNDDEDDWALPRRTPNPFAAAADEALTSVPDLGEALAGEPAESAADDLESDPSVKTSALGYAPRTF
jgi:hypothetical protein